MFAKVFEEFNMVRDFFPFLALRPALFLESLFAIDVARVTVSWEDCRWF
jgi:hypothetical protein